jgi:hypothetical protein
MVRAELLLLAANDQARRGELHALTPAEYEALPFGELIPEDFPELFAWEMRNKGVPKPAETNDNRCAVFHPGDNFQPSMGPQLVLSLLLIDYLRNADAAAQGFMGMRAIAAFLEQGLPQGVPDSRFLAVNVPTDSLAANYIPNFPPALLYEQDQQAMRGARYYVMQLFPVMTFPVSATPQEKLAALARMTFSVGLYVVPTRGFVLTSARVGDRDDAGFGVESVLANHYSKITARSNPYFEYDTSRSYPARSYMTMGEIREMLLLMYVLASDTRAKKGCEEAVNPKRREEILRKIIGLGKNYIFPAPVPAYRIVTLRLDMSV